jgi:hypothetical protein
MNESAVYSESDLAPFRRRLADLHKIVEDDKNGGKHPGSMTKLLERELNHCGAVFPHLHADCVAVSDISTYPHVVLTK